MTNLKKYQSNHHYRYSNRVAFTMLELVFVIMVLGILAALAMPRLDRDLKQEASDSILSDIRYTQHLALRDNKHSFNDPEWQKSFWKISFESCGSSSGLFTGVGTDMDYEGDTDKTEAAIDPANGRPMFWTNTDSCANGGDATVSDRIFITKKYGIKSVAGAGGCNGVQHIGFDHLGRPHVSFSSSTTPDYASYMVSDCTFTFTMSDDDTFAITVQAESGHAFIVGQEDS
jgi:type II secretory pathway pseudopilin PulG